MLRACGLRRATYRAEIHRSRHSRDTAEASEQVFEFCYGQFGRSQHNTAVHPEAIELQVPLAVNVRLRNRDTPVPIENSVDSFAQSEFETWRDLPQTERDRHTAFHGRRAARGETKVAGEGRVEQDRISSAIFSSRVDRRILRDHQLPGADRRSKSANRNLLIMLTRLACILALTAAGGAPFLQNARPAAIPSDALRQTAVDAGKWVRASAIRTDTGVVWPSDPRDPKTVATNLYAGTPGIVLFLLELHRATGNEEYLNDARAGADHLLATIDSEPPAGLYTGIGGIGFTLGEVFRATKDQKYADGVRRVITRLSETAKPTGDGVEWSNVTDVIGGTAGTGLFLLHAARTLPSSDALQLAGRAGRHLLQLGTPEQGGTKWAMSPEFPRLMPNFSHGTAGIAYFLADLYQATKNPAFLDGGFAGARYLKAVAKTEGDVCLIFHHEPEEDGKNLFYLGYCHGPAGTARLWYKLYQVTGDREWLTWTERSARAILTSGIPEQQTPGFWNNVSQCCGSAGVAAFFLALHQVTGKPEYLAFSRKVTNDLMKRATRDERGTRWVQAEHRVRPELLVAQTGWMQGASGIGAWLLQMDAFERRQKPMITLPDNPFGPTERAR